MLGILAAIVPILGSLTAAAWFLVEQSRIADERRRRRRIEERCADMSPLESEAVRAVLLAANGLRLDTGSDWLDFNVTHQMNTQPVASAEVSRQWLVLGSALVGLVLLAVDIASA